MAYISARRKRNPTIFKAILNRQIHGANISQDIHMIRTMIESGRAFKKVFDQSSRSPVVYMGDKVYFDSFSTCYDITSAKPRIVYSLQRQPPKKIEEMQLFESPLDQNTFLKVQGTLYANGPYTIGVTADNYLKVFDVDTGKSFNEVYLFPGRKFKYLYWEKDLDRLVVQSTLLSIRSTAAHVMPRVPTQADPVFVYLAVFSVTPLEFICMLPISHKIFGANLCNASVRNGLLIVLYRKKRVQFFNLEDILKNHTIPLKLGDSLTSGNNLCLPGMDEFSSGIVGMPPLGLPVNVALLEKPCVLFEVVSSDHDICFGGYPWHYISNINEVFHVRSVNDHTLAENGTLENNSMTFGLETAFFHADLSGRVLYVTSSYVRCLKLGPASSCPGSAACELHDEYIIDFRESSDESNINVQTRSGRKVKQLFNSQDSYPEMEIIHYVDYDDELDLLIVLCLSQTTVGEGIVGFFDNQTGKHLRDLSIVGLSEGEHSVAINRNLLVIISKDVYTYRCLVYDL